MKELGIIYGYICIKLEELSDLNDSVKTKEFNNYVLGKLFHIPKDFRSYILREMMVAGMVKQKRGKIILLEVKRIKRSVNEKLVEMRKESHP